MVQCDTLCPCQTLHKSYVCCQKTLNLQHTFIFGEIGEFILGLEIVSGNTDSVSLPKFMSFSIIQRSSNKASKSTSPLPVNIQRFPYQCSIWHLLITYEQCCRRTTLFIMQIQSVDQNLPKKWHKGLITQIDMPLNRKSRRTCPNQRKWFHILLMMFLLALA